MIPATFAGFPLTGVGHGPPRGTVPERRKITMRMWKLALLAGCLSAVAIAGPAFASGFSVYEQGAKASAQAGAFAARADDPAANWYNPAGLARQKGIAFQIGANLITIGSDTTLDMADDQLGTGSFEAIQNNEFPIHIYFAHKINDRIAWGFGINNPFGLTSEWKNWPVTAASKRAEFMTFVFNPNIAFALGEHWSLAVGLDYLYANVSEFSSQLAQTLPLTQNLTGNGDAFGFNLAGKFESGPWSAGLTYRSAFSPTVDGDVKVAVVSLPASAEIRLPAQASIAGAYKLGQDWDFEMDFAWSQWSRFDSLDIDVTVPGSGTVRNSQAEDWKDTYSVRFGAGYRIAEVHELRFGALWDKNPIPDNRLRPSIPDGDRWSVTLGYGYAGKRWGIDAYYMPLFFQDRQAKRDPGLEFGEDDTVISGTYSSFVHLLGATVSVKF
jgi:long-chain fatty acid transport protein